MGVKPKKSAEDKENRSELFNTPSKVETPMKPKPIALKSSPNIVENFVKEVP